MTNLINTIKAGGNNRRICKIGSIVETPHGRGVIVDEEVYKTCERWGVKLDKNPFSFPVAFYFKKEIKPL